MPIESLGARRTGVIFVSPGIGSKVEWIMVFRAPLQGQGMSRKNLLYGIQRGNREVVAVKLA